MTDATNLILFQSDNHNRGVLGCYGHPIVQTPVLDRLAATGTRFSNAYASSPLCCPSRATLACGRYPHQTGYWDNCLVYDGRHDSWARRLREQGHTVTSVGKLHFRSTEDDNGFTEELAPMHIVDGVGGLVGLLRWSGEEPTHHGQWELYADESGVGTTAYQDYDRRISDLAVEWLRTQAIGQTKPWTLYVSYVSAHPPFTVPESLWDLYPVEDMPLPLAFQPGERPEHPSYQYLRRVLGWQAMTDETMLRKVAAGYFALITHLDRQIGLVIEAAEQLGLLANTRIAYTSDHGEAFGQHGLFGKANLLEHSVGVPLLMSGPGIEAGRVVDQIVSHADLYPTIVESAGGALTATDDDLPGTSLWPALQGHESDRAGFAEYHAIGAGNSGFVQREGEWKLIYTAHQPPQLFNLADDPNELEDLYANGTARGKAAELEAHLRARLDPEAVDAQSKQAQKARAIELGGDEAIRQQGAFQYTPPPGSEAVYWK